MDRKTFLGTLLALPAGLFLVHCSSNSSNGSSGAGGPAAPPMRSGTLTVYTSNDSGTPAHHHTFSIDDSAITAPPSAGISGSTSTEETHSHTVMVSMAMLTQIAAGQSVQVVTGDTFSHSHIFTFMKIA